MPSFPELMYNWTNTPGYITCPIFFASVSPTEGAKESFLSTSFLPLLTSSSRFPVVSFEAVSGKSNTYQVSQKRYFDTGDSSSNQTWWIPLTVMLDNGTPLKISPLQVRCRKAVKLQEGRKGGNRHSFLFPLGYWDSNNQDSLWKWLV